MQINHIDSRFLILDHKVASGSYGYLYKGTYRSQEMAIKILKIEHINIDLEKEFAQEVYILRYMWNEDLMFVAVEPFEEPLILSVEDRVGPNKDNLIELGKIRILFLEGV
ncbi:ACT-like protein tyrosine kinase family protein [Artemisia annua]|uniref:ACT-like protein tyrosine kinase family protein n=1 Tax=Artemisia annua TaxID=35608 RepID=A0A2U1LVP0_ARTAN|nr:ACT-like protein tyrosine kinase family protein [Artemisia annua]